MVESQGDELLVVETVRYHSPQSSCYEIHPALSQGVVPVMGDIPFLLNTPFVTVTPNNSVNTSWHGSPVQFWHGSAWYSL